MSEHEISTRNLLCPMPVIRTQDKIKTLVANDILTVTATDPGTLNDIPTWCRINGHEVLNQEQDGRDIIFIIKVGND